MSPREKLWLPIILLLFGMAHVWGASILAHASQALPGNPALLARLGD